MGGCMTNSEALIKKVMQEHKKDETDNYEETIEALIKMSNDGTLIKPITGFYPLD